MLFRNFALLPGPVDLWSGEWVSFGVSGITVEDVRVWPYSVSLLVKISAFLGTLHWPVAAGDLGVGGVSFVELLILYELWGGERLSLEKAVLGIGELDVQFQCRLFRLVQALIFGVLVGFLGPFFVPFLCCLVVWRSIFLGVLGLIIVAFGTLVGISVVMVLHPGHVRLLLFGFWMSFLFFLGIHLPLVLVCFLVPYLLSITLRVLLVGFLLGACLGVAVLLVFLLLGSSFGVVPSALSAALGGASVCLASGSGGGVKRVRLFRKTPAHLARQGISAVQVRPRVWKRLRDPLGSDSSFPFSKFLRVHQEAGGHDPGFVRAGIGSGRGTARAPRLQVLA